MADMGALDLFGGLVALRDLGAVGNPPHVDLGGGRPLAGMEVLGGEHDVELAVDLDDVALADLAGDDFQGLLPSLSGRRVIARADCQRERLQ